MKKRTVLILLCVAFLFCLVPVTSIQSNADLDMPNGNVIKTADYQLGDGCALDAEYLQSCAVFSDQRPLNSKFTRGVMFVGFNSVTNWLYFYLVVVGYDNCFTSDTEFMIWFRTVDNATNDQVNYLHTKPMRLDNRPGYKTGVHEVTHQVYSDSYVFDGPLAFHNIYFGNNNSYCVWEVAIYMNSNFATDFVNTGKSFGAQFTVTDSSVSENGYCLIGGYFIRHMTIASSDSSNPYSDVDCAAIPTHSWFVNNVTVSWNVPIFELQYSNWNTETHQYDTKAVKGTATVTVTNNSKLLDLNITPSFSKTGNWRNYFDGVLSSSALTRVGHDPTNSGSSRPNSATFSLTLNTNNSTPSALSGQVQVGTFTVKLSSPYQS